MSRGNARCSCEPTHRRCRRESWKRRVHRLGLSFRARFTGTRRRTRPHEWHFHQVEGLAVDKEITFADLKGTLYEFARRTFGEDRQIRFRCDFFPFVEQGVDMAISNFRDPKTGKRPINRDEDLDRDPWRGNGASQCPGGSRLRPLPCTPALRSVSESSGSRCSSTASTTFGCSTRTTSGFCSRSSYHVSRGPRC